MPNMSYCRFQNTLKDLRDCYEHMYDSDMNDADLSDEEKAAAVRLVKLCKRIAEEFE